MPETTTLGADFAHALAAKDYGRIVGLMQAEIDFRGMTPRLTWEASDPETLVSAVLRQWLCSGFRPARG